MIVCGARHFDPIMRATIKAMGMATVGWEQGFIDQYDNFLTRKEAWTIADKMGQIRRPTGFEDFLHARPTKIGDDGNLFSENLY
jgi:hypothetical protein